MPFSEIECLKQRALNLCLGLSHHLDEIHVSDFPTSNPLLLIEFTEEFLKKAKEKVEAAQDETDIKPLNWICLILEGYGELLSYLDNANSDRTPRALVQILEDLSEKLFPTAKLIASPQSEYNYTISDLFPYLEKVATPVAGRAKDKKALLDKLGVGPFNHVSFPRIARDDILSHSIFGHELGHKIADEFLEQEDARTRYLRYLDQASKKISSYLQKHVPGKSATEMFKLQTRFIEALLEIRKRGLEELISDCVAVLLLGPSAIFALYDLFLTSDFDELPDDPEYYPPPRMRLRAALSLADDQDFILKLNSLITRGGLREFVGPTKSTLAHVEVIVSQMADQAAIAQSELLKLAYDWISTTLPHAIGYAKRRTAKIAYDSDLIRTEVPELIRRLALGVPPNEIGIHPNAQVVDWRSALLAGWIYKISGRPLPNNEELKHATIEDRDRLQRLTMRAIEFVMLQKRIDSERVLT